MNKTSIGWTDLTSNPIRYKDAAGNMVWGCERTSPGCAHCYAADLAKRYGRGAGAFTEEEMATYTPYFDEKEAHHILNARVVAGQVVKGSKCFIGDMTDIFGEWVPDALLDQLFATMALRPDVTFQILTKRPERMRDYMRGRDWGQAANRIKNGEFFLGGELVPPLPNVWLGVSVENQHFANERIPLLLQTPAAVRFISAEPLLGGLDLVKWLKRGSQCDCGIHRGTADGCEPQRHVIRCNMGLRRLDWAIIGGESGDDFRDPGVQAIVDTVQQVTYSGVPAFVKQDAHLRPGQQGRIPDVVWAFKQFPTVAA